ncbi:MAG: hypothetical protein ACI9SE_003012 [Neolewinella sp.]|jgi:hypothetical protein
MGAQWCAIEIGVFIARSHGSAFVRGLTIATGHSATKPLEQRLCDTSTASMEHPLRYRELPAHRFLPPPAIAGPKSCVARAHTATWQRRNPEETVLYRAVQSEWATSLTQLEAGDRHVPRFCRREVEAFLRCGILAHGFARVFCAQCRHDDVVAFSCKGRGFCPSCGTRRMVDTAALLVDQVIPDVAPVRQWVLSLPYRVRLLCAHDPMALSAVRRILVRAVSGYYERTAKRFSKPVVSGNSIALRQRELRRPLECRPGGDTIWSSAIPE